MEADWRPIETAPKDGTQVLLALPEARLTIAVWTTPDEMHGPDPYLAPDDPRYDNEPRWFEEWGPETDDTPTHWMPLPEPPTQPPEGESDATD